MLLCLLPPLQNRKITQIQDFRQQSLQNWLVGSKISFLQCLPLTVQVLHLNNPLLLLRHLSVMVEED